jgi:hypothetical protein
MDFIKKYKRELAYGFSIFGSVYIVLLVLWPLRIIQPNMHSAIVTIIITFSLIYHSMSYFLPHKKNYHLLAMRASFFWFVMFNIFGYFAYTTVPFYMTPVDYLFEIGILSILLLLIPNGIGCMGKQVRTK